MNIGLIGCGSIGTFLLESLNIKGVLPGCRISAVLEHKGKPEREVAERYGVTCCPDLESLLKSDLNMVVEAANIQTVKAYACRILESGKHMVIISIGALADEEFGRKVEEAARTGGAQIYLPSGAIGGLDILKAAASMKQLDSVTLTTRKPAKSLTDEPLEAEKVLYDGTASEAIRLFPKNINVSIILSLAGLGVHQTRVRIIADPSIDRNIHVIEASGAFGKMLLQVENTPMPSNTKTSYLAALSILSVLRNGSRNLHIGS